MARTTGTYCRTKTGDETVRAFVPHGLPPRRPTLKIEGKLQALHLAAVAALEKLEVSGAMVPSANWFLYGFVRKEAVVSSQIEGTQATLQDVLSFEAGGVPDKPDDIQEICNYIDALEFARRELAKPRGLPLCTRMLCAAHKRLMKGVRGADKQPGTVRTSQNWIGGTRPGNARFVPPPPGEVPGALAALERWIHAGSSLQPLVRAGLAHVQFETIHPFLDGNGRIGRLLITLLLEHWGLLSSPLLYLSLAFKRHRQSYYRRLSGVRTDGDWEGWTEFFLKCVGEAAEDATASAREIFTLVGEDRRKIVNHPAATVPAIRLFDLLPENPMITLAQGCKLLKTSNPTVTKAVKALQKTGILAETTGKRRGRVYAYTRYLKVLSPGTDLADK